MKLTFKVFAHFTTQLASQYTAKGRSGRLTFMVLAKASAPRMRTMNVKLRAKFEPFLRS